MYLCALKSPTAAIRERVRQGDPRHIAQSPIILFGLLRATKSKAKYHKISRPVIKHKKVSSDWRAEARERDIADNLRKYSETTHLRQDTLAEDQQVYSVKVVTAF